MAEREEHVAHGCHTSVACHVGFERCDEAQCLVRVAGGVIEIAHQQGGEYPVGVFLHDLCNGFVDFRGIVAFYSRGIVFQKLGEAFGVGVSACSHFGRV